ncbi:hypothetical protein [Bifidobacterium sp. ESL0732]|uniref:hypothetical protein n=1 Tax=Bifidobacterium sp. ESL0732 TaxID=2983222 RepID=UPI0023F7B3C9|nr:hypothetical protein [Bifidobacterium sp. ESL0732]WEV63421.1 hypothetical protein OZX70_05485 [Bifidobacterium sp. ESL0732]
MPANGICTTNSLKHSGAHTAPLFGIEGVGFIAFNYAIITAFIDCLRLLYHPMDWYLAARAINQ